MKRTLNLAATAMVIALSTQPAWAGLTVYIPLGSANKVIAVDAASNHITATYEGVENPHGLVATPDGEYLIAGNTPAARRPDRYGEQQTVGDSSRTRPRHVDPAGGRLDAPSGDHARWSLCAVYASDARRHQRR